MVAFGPGISCRDAEPYYYDYLSGPQSEVPQEVVDHIRHCAKCETQIKRLEAAVDGCETRDCDGHDEGDVAGALGLHFSHLGEEITCATAKPYLPMLLIPSLQIRIPTPVTVHVDHCPRCAEDLESLRGLELRPEQLARLSRLYAADGSPSHLCRGMKAEIWAFACASFDGIDAGTLDHVCTCPRCRERVYQRREKMLAGRKPGDTIPGVGLCTEISAADLFDWVVPFGRNGGSAPRDETIPAHLQACPECIERVQALHRRIYSIADRVDSGISTVYTAGVAGGAGEGRVESPYYGYPIHVEVGQRDAEPEPVRFRPVARLREAWDYVMSPQFRPARRAAMAMAALIVVGVLLFVDARPVIGTREQQLTDAIKRIENLHISYYSHGETTAIREYWVAYGAGLAMVHNREKDTTFYDLNRSEMVSRNSDGGEAQRMALTREDKDNFDMSLDSMLRPAMSATPVQEERLPRVVGFDEAIGNDSVVCESFSEKPASNGRVVQYGLKSFLDPVTGLPRATVSYDMQPGKTEWRPTGVRVFTYPDRREAEAAIRRVLSE